MDSHTAPRIKARPSRRRGYTLIEILVAISIVVTSLISIPGIYQLVIKETVISELNQVSSLLHTARLFAINYQTTVIVCPTTDDTSCEADWRLPKMAFEDRDGNGQRSDDDNETLIAKLSRSDKIKINWNNGERIRISADTRQSTNGTLSFCPANSEYDNQARALAVSLQGRVRLSNNFSCGN